MKTFGKILGTLLIAIGATWLFVATAVAAQAHSHTLRLKPGEGLSQALERAGYNQGWIAQVMADNRISPDSLRYLPAGKSVRIRPDYQFKAPPAPVVRFSRLILQYDQGESLRRKERLLLGNLRQSLATAQVELVRNQKALGDSQKEVVGLKTDKSIIQQRLDATEALLAQSFGRKTVILLVVSAFILGLGLLAAILQARWRSSQWATPVAQQIPDPDQVHIHREVRSLCGDRQVVFALDSYQRDPAATDNPELVAFYRCSLCTEQRIRAHNISRHIAQHERQEGAAARVRQQHQAGA
ncbi:MAG: hypothetical protein Q7S32_01850 [bacterium]|nr:hypothetical protein [bacterium]